MPYKSDAQRKYFNANKQELEKKGVDVNEWNQSSKVMNLPERKSRQDKNKMFKNHPFMGKK